MPSQTCPDCEAHPELGTPSLARWIGPDGGAYCSLHFVHRFGHHERLVRVDGYEPPTKRKPALAKEKA